jgi:serine/threonine-protein kinase
MTPRGPTALAGNVVHVSRRICPLCDALLSAEICPNDGTSTLSLDAPSSDPERLHPGRIIADRYRIEASIGRGGFSKVFRAVHNGTGQNVALKVLGGGGLEDTASLRRFFREARASAGLRHPNTVRVFDFGQEDDGIVFLAMELLTGKTLRAYQRLRLEEGGAICERETIEIAIAVTQSLGEAHSLGLVHRDVGPNNIFIHEVVGSDRVVKLLDFGLVKDGGLRPLTMGTDICGTVSYMSPEHLLGHRVTPRSDLYSLGITMWWMLAGDRPFGGENHREVMRGHLQDPLPSLVEHSRSPVSAELQAVIEKATAKDPAERYEDAHALREALEHCLDLTRERTEKLEPVLIDKTLPLARSIEVTPLPRPRKRAAPLVAGALLGALAAFLWWPSRPAPAVSAPAPAKRDVVREDSAARLGPVVRHEALVALEPEAVELPVESPAVEPLFVEPRELVEPVSSRPRPKKKRAAAKTRVERSTPLLQEVREDTSPSPSILKEKI